MTKIEIKKIHFELTWHVRHKVMWPKKRLDYIKLQNDRQGLHYGLFANDQLASVVSVFVINQKAQFRKFATLADEQGKGYGTLLLKHLFLELENKEVTQIWCNAREDKTQFYERFEMTQTKEVFDKGGINYVIMKKLLT